MNHFWLCAAAGATDRGRQRKANQDEFFVDEARGLFIVADGMGGHAHGEIASAEVIRKLDGLLVDAPGVVSSSAARTEHVRDALIACNRSLYERNCSEDRADGDGMGAAVAGVWVGAPIEPAVVFHIGDCRVYVWRGGQLVRLTSDHSAYQDWVDRGGVGTAPRRNLLTRCIGPRAQVEPEVQTYQLQAGDRCLICSDGVTTMLRDDEIAWLMGESHAHPLSVACQRIINEANDRGGDDNVTAVLVHIRG